jgi:pimeloyl-ACP methyl ester carboxylesterase
LFLLAGGPGQSAMQVYVALSSAFARINRNHAIVLLDQRGTGHSSLQSCEYPEDWQEPADPIPALRKATSDCVAKLGQRVRFYTTSVAVRDLNDMRMALGYDQIDLYGGSYGTRVAELFMRRYPAHVHAVILDGVTYPQQAIGAETPQDGERALNLIVARCMQTPDCAATYPQLPNELSALLQKFGPQKATVTIDDPNSGLPLDIEFNRRILNAALRLLSYSSTQASLLPALIHEAAHGKLRPLAAQSVMNMRQISDQLANGMQYSVICSEDEPFFAGNIDRAAMAKTYQGTDMVDALREICALWPRGPVDADLHAPLHSDIPTLLLSGEADPVTPPLDAERAAEGLTRHRHLILKGEGHGQLSTGCVPILAADFLDNAAPDKLDAGCLERHTPEPFFLSMTGPSP